MRSHFNFIRLATTLVLFAAAILLSGCSRPTGSVSGKVTYQGKALKGGSVSFISSEGRQSFAAGIGEDGNFSVPNLVGGSYKVCVETDSLKPARQGPTMPGQTGIPKDASKMGPPPGAPVPEGYTPSNPAAAAVASSTRKYVSIPAKYASADTTDLTYEFSGGTQTHDIELK